MDDLEAIRQWVFRRSPLRWLLKQFGLKRPDTTFNSTNANLRFPNMSFDDQDFGLMNSIAGDGPVNIAILDSSCEPLDTAAATALAAAIGVLFGAVHCSAWNFQFLSPEERTL